MNKLDLEDFVNALTMNEGILYQKWILQMYFTNEEIANMTKAEIKSYYETIKEMEIERMREDE